MYKRQVESMVELFANEQLHQMIFSNPVQKDGILKVRIRPVNLRGRLLFQAEELVGTQAFHKNPVSYTHLDVYKRQPFLVCAPRARFNRCKP